jgi:hypothetical protein
MRRKWYLGGYRFHPLAWYLTGADGIIPGMDTTSPDLNAAVATVLNMYKTGLKVTLAELVDVTGIPKVSLQRYLSGDRVMNMAQVKAVAGALGMTPGEVYDEAERWIERQKRRDTRPADKASDAG